MNLKMRSYAVIPFLALSIGFIFQTCNKKCRSIESSYSGAVIGLYDFKDCYIYAKVDSNLLIRSDTAFANYKSKNFIHCDAGALDPVDFSKNMILGFKTTTSACNAAFHRKVEIDSLQKQYRYIVEIERCNGCGTELTSSNFVIAPQLPAGFTMTFIRIEK